METPFFCLSELLPLPLSRLAPLVPYGLCPLTVLTPFGGKEVGELWHFLSWVHSCPTPSATFKGPSNSSEMGVGGWSARLQAQPSPHLCYKCSKVGPFYWWLPTKNISLEAGQVVISISVHTNDEIFHMWIQFYNQHRAITSFQALCWTWDTEGVRQSPCFRELIAMSQWEPHYQLSRHTH